MIRANRLLLGLALFLAIVAEPARPESEKGADVAQVLPDGAIARLGNPGDSGRPIHGIRLSPDGSTLATVSGDGTVHLWDVSQRKERFTWPNENRWGNRAGVLFAPNGKWLAADWTVISGGSGGENERRTILRDVATGKELHRVAGTFHASSADSKVLTTTWTKVEFRGSDKKGLPYEVAVYHWDVESGRQLKVETTNTAALNQACISNDGKLRAGFTLADRRMQLGTIDLGSSDGTETRRIGEENGEQVVALRFDANDRILISSGVHKTTFWEVESGKQLFADLVPVKNTRGPRTDMAPNGRALAVAWHEPGAPQQWGVRIYETATGKLRSACLGHASACDFVWSGDAVTLASASTNNDILIWDPSGMVRQRVAKAPTAAELDGLWTALGGDDAAAAYRAIGTLAARPGESVPYLKDRIQQLLKPPPRVAQLIASLDDANFDVRGAATAELVKMGSSIEPYLRAALGAKPALEQHRRIEAILDRLKGQAPFGETLRLLRVIEAMEMNGSAPALELLQMLADRLPGSLPAHDSMAALARLDAHKP